MAEHCQSVSETLADIAKRRPVLSPVLDAFSPLLQARSSLAEKLLPMLEESRFVLPLWQEERAQQGAPLLAGAPLQGLFPLLKESASALLPHVAALPGMAGYEEPLRTLFENESTSLSCADSLLTGHVQSLARIAEDLSLPPEVLLFAAEIVAGPVFQAIASTYHAPWDSRPSAWMQGFCPVCGSFPSISYLDKRVFDEKNAFLAGGGGKKHLHCSLCGTNWHFRRGACPSCGKEGSGVMEFLRESSGSRGERIDWCTACKSYCPSVDLRERDAAPNMDAMALGMMYMDIIAAQKGLKPLKPSFWNQF